MATFSAPLTRLLKKAFSAEDTPDPWDDEIDEAVRTKESTAICSKCLEPGADETWLCRNCGWPSGDYVNVNPYLYIYSIGAFFRSGVDGSVNLTPSKILGLGTIALWEYGVFAPVYWVRLFQAKHQQSNADSSTPTDNLNESNSE